MKKEDGKISTNVLIIIIIMIIVIISGVSMIVLLSTGVIKIGNNELKIGNKNEKNSNTVHTDQIKYIDEDDDTYFFIDTDGNLVKLSKDAVGKRNVFNSFTSDAYSVFYNNSMLIEKDDKYALIDFDGNTIFESNSEITRRINTKDKTLYEFQDNNKYGIIDAKGNIILPAEYSNSIEALNSKYLYTYDYNSDKTGETYIIKIFNTDGKKTYEGDSSEHYFFGAEQVETKSGVYACVLDKSKNSEIVLNLNSGEIIQTVEKVEYRHAELKDGGSALGVEWYEKSENDSEYKSKTNYYWFGDDGKVSKKCSITDKIQFSSADGKEFSILTANSKKYILNKNGDIVYNTENSIYQNVYRNIKNNETRSVFQEEVGRKKYKIINENMETILEEKISSVGNKYVLANKVLYKYDGTKYMENVEKYYSIYNFLDVIKTSDKIIIENSQGKQIEQDKDFKISDTGYILNDNTVVFNSNKIVSIIDVNELTIKTLDLSSYEYVFVEDGYIYASDDNKKTYYNRDGEVILEIEK